MSPQGDESTLEYQIRELHREKLEKELEGLSELFEDYTNHIEESTQKRRRENIYVLFALGIIGAFFSVLPRETFTSNGIFLPGFGIFALASLIFLLLKLNTVALSEVHEQGTTPNKVDNYSEYLFVFSVNGMLILILMSGIISILGIQVRTAIEISTAVAGSVFFASLITLLKVYFEEQRKRERRQRIRRESEEIVSETVDEIREGIKKLSEADQDKERLRIYHELAGNIEYLNNESPRSEDVDEISDALNGSEGIPENILELLQDELEKLETKIYGDDSGEKTLEERLEELRQERRKIVGIADSEQD